MPAKKISIDEAKKEKLFYFVANVVVYRGSDGRCLILKRHEREKSPIDNSSIANLMPIGNLDIGD